MKFKILKGNIGKYFIISCLASVIDFSIAYLLYRLSNLNYLLACNIGIISGFMFQYFLCVKYVFKSKGALISLTVYIVTFFFGVALADGTMWVCYNRLNLPFFASKAFSMAIPFFITYNIRKLLFGLKQERSSEIENTL